MTEIARKSTTYGAGATSRAAIIAARIFLALLGTGLIFGVGFAGSDILHNAAHDTRHANGFPCH